MHLPYDKQPKQPITPRINNGDVHFTRVKDISKTELSPNNSLETKTFDARNDGPLSPLDKFGKKMMKHEKNNISFGGN